MKLSVEQYAKLLYEAYKTSDKNVQEKLIKGVAVLIKKNGAISKLNEIEVLYGVLKRKDLGKIEGTIFTANKLDKKQSDLIKTAVARKRNISEDLVELKNEIDESLKAGFVVDLGTEILDGSLENKVNKVKKALIS